MIAKEFFTEAKDSIIALFIKERAAEYQSFEAKQLKESEVENSYRTILGWVDEKKTDLAYLEEQMRNYAGFEPAATVFNALKANGVNKLPLIISEISGALLLKEHLPAIVELVRRDLVLCEQSLARFKAENAQIIKRVEIKWEKEREEFLAGQKKTFKELAGQQEKAAAEFEAANALKAEPT